MIIINKTRNNVLSLLVICLDVFAVLLIGCEKVDLVNTNIVTTAEISYISETNANGGGKIYNGGRTSVSSRGICWGTEPNPTINNTRTLNGTGDGSFTSILTDLSPNSTYYVRAYASNTHGIVYGNNVSFSTNNSDFPILKTNSISNLTSTTCTSGGSILFEGNSVISSRGVCWSTANPPSITDYRTKDGSGIGVFTSSISGLDIDSIYYIRAYATNSKGTAYGNSLYLKPFKSTIADIDGNEYTTVRIGTQVWTVENMKVTKYQNGDPIPNILENSVWNSLETGAYCDYDNNTMNTDVYGNLYNWFAVSDTRNIAPKGWHVATYVEYQLLLDYLGGSMEADEILRNDGFNALSGGKRNRDGVFLEQGINPYFWTSTEYHLGSNWARYLLLDGGALNIDCLSKNNGFSVRCIRD